MLTNRQIDRVLGKLKRFETTLEPMLFEPITSLDAQMYETEQNLDSAPVDAAYIPAKKGLSGEVSGNIAGFRPSIQFQKSTQIFHYF